MEQMVLKEFALWMSVFHLEMVNFESAFMKKDIKPIFCIILEPLYQINNVLRRQNTSTDLQTETVLDDHHSDSELLLHQVTAVWDQNVLGPPAEVEVSVKTLSDNFNSTDENSSLEDGNSVVVRAEEALIVIFVLMLWVAAIALFFNRWGKIRMLEPYQPKFQQQHRQSCAMVETQNILPHRTSFSRTCLGDNSLYATVPAYPLIRPRQNSVFVGSTTTMTLIPGNPPRKTKSAIDIQSLILAECIAEEREYGRSLSRSHSPTTGFVSGNSLGLPHSEQIVHQQTRRFSSIQSNCKINTFISQQIPRAGMMGSTSIGRMHRNSICVERPSTSRTNYLTITNV